jgi:uncharacterized protein YecE (DUF72 family)
MIRVGTSGYVYKHWKNLLYAGVPARRWFERYSQVFDTVELNTTFYRLPSPAMVESWRRSAPPGFLFACKGSRYLTHMKKLKDVGEGLRRYFELILPLGRALGPVLWQLPPQMDRQDLPRLDAFLGHLPRSVRHAVEFRSAAWYTEECCAVLDRHRAAFCEHDLVDRRPPAFTGGFRYLRFHGATGKYQGRYGKRALARVARSLREFRGDSFAYFNNDVGGHAVRDALDLLELLDLLPERAAEAAASVR